MAKGLEEDKADGHPILRSEGQQMVALKAVLYSNIAQPRGPGRFSLMTYF